MDEQAVRPCQNGRYNVDDLRDAGDLHRIGMAYEAIQELSADQCVLQVVDFLNQVRRVGPGPVYFPVLVPDVPLVEGHGDTLLALLDAADVGEKSGIVAQDTVYFHALGQEPRAVVLGVSAITVGRNVLHVIPAGLEHDAVPFHVGVHPATG